MLKNIGMAALGIMFMATAAQAELPSFAPLARKAGPAVVNISTEREVSSPVMDMFNIPGMERFFEQFGGFGGRRGNGQDAPKRKSTALGSGFIISSDGYIVTNNHVVEGADKITVNLNGGKGKGLQAKVIGTDADTDLALLKVEGRRDLPVLEFGNSDAMEVGDWVLAIGNPLGLNNTVTAGILSAKGRDLHSGPYDNFLQTDASINPGNSGGPLINMKGEVIGINTAIMANGQGLGFSIPSSLASRIIDDLRSGKKVSRGWLGVSIQDVSEDMAKALGIKETRGAIIGKVMPGEPADRAGLQAGDVITSIDGEPVGSASEATRKIAALRPGAEARVQIIRNGEEKTLRVKLGERDATR
ncbi:MAG: Do family serine endopeptidase, partial [Mailhella sp.]|nr:Do family serine endopeptidase [Mailhella sp.]